MLQVRYMRALKYTYIGGEINYTPTWLLTTYMPRQKHRCISNPCLEMRFQALADTFRSLADFMLAIASEIDTLESFLSHFMSTVL